MVLDFSEYITAAYGISMKAKIKFNGGLGALLCNECDIIIANGTDHDKTKEHFCDKCKKEKK